jgi:hypothetical protein
MPDSRGTRIERYISEYSAQGIHRTGSAVDRVSAEWMGNIVSELGCKPDFNEFTFSRVLIKKTELRCNGEVIQGVPLFDCTYTSPEGVSGSIGPLGSNAEVGLVMVPPNSGSSKVKELHAARNTKQHLAIIAVSDSSVAGDGIAVLNAEDYLHPFGTPVLQVANKHWDMLSKAVVTKMSAKAIIHCSREETRALNVGTTVRGSNPSLSPLVVMTPRSGWWQCASERGGGIAGFFEIMRAVKNSKTDRDVIFTANSGHELDHLGLDLYLRDNVQLIQGAVAWIHLGANFATNKGRRVILQFSDDAIRKVALDVVADSGAQVDVEWPIGTRAIGEARNIFDGEGRFVSILGTNDWFHHPADIWPDAVDREATGVWVDVFTRIALELARGDRT